VEVKKRVWGTNAREFAGDIASHRKVRTQLEAAMYGGFDPNLLIK
jgi:hypothetical protein